jgi:hypothetical protein
VPTRGPAERDQPYPLEFEENSMNSVVKIALGTALGILLAGAVAAVVAVIFVGAAFSDDDPAAETSFRTQATTPPAADPLETEATPEDRRGDAAPAGTKRKRARTESTLRACDANISVDAGTATCGFAQNTFFEYWSDQGEERSDTALDVWSPAAQDYFATSCNGDVTVVCTTEDGGEVRFPMSSVEAYDQPQADRYLNSHDTGPDGGSAGGAPATPEPEDSGCDPNYEGACLDSTAYDYDCEGGTGDGPEYVGAVRVVGDDPYDLDRDGDGFACMS